MSRERDDESQSLLRLGLGYQMNFINRYNPSEQALVADILLQLGVQYIQEHSNNPTPSVDQLQLMLTGNQSSESLLGQLKSQVNQLTQQVNSVLEQQHQSQSNAASLSNIGCQTASNQQQQKTAATSTLPTASTGQATMLQRLLDMQQRPHVRPAGMHKRHQQLSYGAYPAWWGHQESASKRPQRKSKTSNNNGKKQQPVTADPWTVPKKTIDEAIQTNERELEYRRQLEEREEQLKRAARRQQTASPLQYSQAESSEGEEYYYYSETDEEGKTKEEGKENVQVETEPHQQQPPQKTSKGFAKYFYTPNKQPQTVNVPKSAPPQRPVFRSMPKRSSPLRQAATKDSGTNINTEVGKEDFISIANHFVQSNFVGCLDL